jgi:hypothetical protein
VFDRQMLRDCFLKRAQVPALRQFTSIEKMAKFLANFGIERQIGSNKRNSLLKDWTNAEQSWSSSHTKFLSSY